jgi:hypothetical protein
VSKGTSWWKYERTVVRNDFDSGNSCRSEAGSSSFDEGLQRPPIQKEIHAMNNCKRWMFVLLVVLSAPLPAKQPEKALKIADTPEKFEVLVAAIRQEMAPEKRYEFLKKSDQATVDAILDKMSGMLKRAGSVDAMTPEMKADLMSAQEKVNGILARNADDRLVCTHVAPVGSHLPITTCHTVREIARKRDNTRHQMIDLADQQRAVDANSRP